MVQQEQQSPSQAQAALIGLYVWADIQWTSILGKAYKRLQNSGRAFDLTNAMAFMRHHVRQVVATLDQQTPLLLDNLTRSVEHEAEHLTLRLPPKPPIGIGLLEPPDEPPFDFTVHLSQRATNAIRLDLQTELKDIRARILRQQNDLYKLTAAGAATHSVGENGDPIKVAQQRMMSDLLQHGVTGFTDRAGRDWQLSSYVEMAVRTSTIRALNEAHIEVMTAAGISLFTVPVHVHTCPICHKWQGKVLSLAPDPQADATVDEARVSGLWHPNCEHTLTAWHEGDKRPKPADWTDADESLWKSTQRQRWLERAIRAQKCVLAYSNVPELRVQARKKIRDYQTQIRGLTASTGLLRRSHREQLDLGLRK